MVYVFHVDGYEDTELIAPLDMLSRAGIPFTRVGVTGKTITSKLGFTIEADITPEQLDLSDCEMIFLPGGPGTKNYFDKPVIDSAIAYCMEHDRHLCGTVRSRCQRRAGRKTGCLPFQRRREDGQGAGAQGLHGMRGRQDHYRMRRGGIHRIGTQDG